MKKRIWMLGACTVVGAAVCALLQRYLFANCVDAAGLIVSGTPALWLLAMVTAAVFAALAILCAGLQPGGSVPQRHVGAGVLLLASSILVAAQLLRGGFAAQGKLGLVIALLQLTSALVFALDGVFCLTGRRGSLVADCAPPVWLALLLIGNYRSWSSDPIVLDYCFLLLFTICAMLALHQLGSFRVGKGRRRVACFWTFAAIFCALITLTDSMLTAALLPALLAALLLMLRQSETP